MRTQNEDSSDYEETETPHSSLPLADSNSTCPICAFASGSGEKATDTNTGKIVAEESSSLELEPEGKESQ